MNFILGDRLRGPLPARLGGLLLPSLLRGGGPFHRELGCAQGWRQPVLQPLRPLWCSHSSSQDCRDKKYLQMIQQPYCWLAFPFPSQTALHRTCAHARTLTEP